MKKKESRFADFADGHTAVTRPALGTMAKKCGGSQKAGRTAEVLKRFQQRFAKAARDKRRDNTVLEDAAHRLIAMYASNKKAYKDLQRDPAHPASVKRLLGCGSLLGSVSPTMITAESESVIQAGLAHCGSVWACPSCAAKIQTQRATEVETLIKWALDHKLVVSMVTLTARHDRSDSLLWLSTAFQAAYAAHNRGRAVRRMKEIAHFIGLVRTTEVTWGVAAGWHWHNHLLVISNHKPDGTVWREAWIRALISVGFIADGDQKAIDEARQHAFKLDTVTPDDQAAPKKLGRYITKMANTPEGAAREMALSGSKLGRKANRTPFQLVKDCFTVDTDAEFARDSRLFIEYVLATKGRHQMVWSKYLKAACGIKNLLDDEIVNNEDAEEKATILWGLRREHLAALREDGWLNEYLRDVAPSRSIEAAQSYFDTMFADRGLPRLVPPDETRQIWEAEREQRRIAGEKYRNGELDCSRDYMTDEERLAVYCTNHPRPKVITTRIEDAVDAVKLDEQVEQSIADMLSV